MSLVRKGHCPARGKKVGPYGWERGKKKKVTAQWAHCHPYPEQRLPHQVNDASLSVCSLPATLRTFTLMSPSLWLSSPDVREYKSSRAEWSQWTLGSRLSELGESGLKLAAATCSPA
jgi:hypothetical protein